MPSNPLVPRDLQPMAAHTMKCRPCMQKASRLFDKPPHRERMELLCAIEYCYERSRGRRAHS